MYDVIEESSFEVDRGQVSISAVLWQVPTAETARPLVLLGHGGSGHKRSSRQVELAHRLARSGLAVAAIDGPFHGERVAEPLSPAAYQQLIVDRGVERVLDDLTEDWLALIAAVSRHAQVRTDRLGYLGMSMATRFGLPLAAALGERLHCAVLGKFGLEQSPALHPGMHTPQRIMSDASCVVAPVMYHVQWNDEIFPRAGQFALFDGLASSDKRLVAFPGPHAGSTDAVLRTWCRYLTEKLLDSSGR
ncbi:dienelactone hydrolase family protein [Kribbella sp. NBC_01510]|uniref:dienelactone hydrolase family protein n=1 Tax=Kribbella sp. NBC_01510 TaxID=2903581 RepID=UPI00386625E4